MLADSLRMVPVKPRYQGFIGSISLSFIKSLILLIISTGLNWGIFVDQPVPIPVVPFIKIIGSVGI